MTASRAQTTSNNEKKQMDSQKILHTWNCGIHEGLVVCAVTELDGQVNKHLGLILGC